MRPEKIAKKFIFIIIFFITIFSYAGEDLKPGENFVIGKSYRIRSEILK